MKLNESMKSQRNIKIVLVDDHQKFRDVMKVLLKSIGKYELVGEFENGHEFLSGYNGSADIILMDIKMPLMNGMNTTKKALTLYPGIKIIGLSLHHETEYEEQIKKMGAKGLISKFAIEENLEKEIDKAIKM